MTWICLKRLASIPKERIQVYFIDNDEYFKGKQHLQMKKLCTQTMMSVLFSLQKVVETKKKLNWVPDIIHVHGWMAAMLPIYMKHYKNEALFSDTKIVTSVYSQSL
jgi:starch synthase